MGVITLNECAAEQNSYGVHVEGCCTMARFGSGIVFNGNTEHDIATGHGVMLAMPQGTQHLASYTERVGSLPITTLAELQAALAPYDGPGAAAASTWTTITAPHVINLGNQGVTLERGPAPRG
jgi:hypothetical protein